MAILIQAADYPIKSVTVFKSFRAEVVRTFNLSLQKGQNKVDISGLSSTIDTQSVRISGLADARLLDIITTVKSASVEDVSPTSSDEVIRKLEEKLAAIECSEAIMQKASGILTMYGETLTGEHVEPYVMNNFLSNYIKSEKNRLEESLTAKEEILKLRRGIMTEREKASSKKGSAYGHVDAVLLADMDTRIELTLTYLVSDASWKPTYELHATTENGKPSSSVKLHYRARVNQSTGEDWSNTTLTLSTVSSDTVARQIPHLRPVTLHQPQPGFRRKKVKQPNVGPFFVVSNNVGPGFQKTSLFGQNNNTNTFGQQQQQQQQQTQTTGPFGHPVPQTATFGTQQQRTGFGAPLPAQSPFGTTTTGTGLFAAPPGPFAGPFGSAIPQPVQPSSGFGGGGLFGPAAFSGAPANPVGAAPPPPSGFGAAGGGGLFGAAVPSRPAASAFSNVPAAAVPPNEEEPQDEEFEELIEDPSSDPITVVTETPIAISFSVSGESNIPSNGVDHQVSIAVLPFSAKVSYIAIPRIDPQVFLQCEVKNTSEYRLLPGPVIVILDDSYVSKTTINDINTGDDFEFTLGDDASARVTYERTSKTIKSEGGTFSEVTNTTTYTTKISIHNKHQFPINDLIVRDVIPTCEDKRLKIVLRKPKGLADAKDGEWVNVIPQDGLRVGWERVVDGKGGEKEGRFEWKWKVEPGAKVLLHAEWEVKAPGEIAWVEEF